jgi:hypothetical protein
MWDLLRRVDRVTARRRERENRTCELLRHTGFDSSGVTEAHAVAQILVNGANKINPSCVRVEVERKDISAGI